MSLLHTAHFYAERLRNSPYDFAAQLLLDEHCVAVIGGLLERIQSALIYRRAALHGVRDVINAPPGAASWMEAVLQPAWRLGHDPRIQIEVITSPDMADQARDLIAHPDYAQIFPGVELVATGAPSVLQTTAGGRIVYRTLWEEPVDIRPKLLVIETPQRRPDVATPAARDAAFGRVEEALSRLSAIGSAVLVTHRLHPDDLTGRLAIQGSEQARRKRGFTVWSFPVIAQEDLIYQLGDEAEQVCKGDLLDPNAWDHARIAQLQRLLTPASFVACYLQVPLDTPVR